MSWNQKKSSKLYDLNSMQLWILLEVKDKKFLYLKFGPVGSFDWDVVLDKSQNFLLIRLSSRMKILLKFHILAFQKLK